MMRLLKTLTAGFAVAAAGLCALPAQAQSVSEHINFQGRLTNAAGNPITSPPSTSVTFRLFNVATAGTALWSETLSISPNANGIYAVRLGVGTTFSSAGITWNQTYYLEIQVAGETSPMTPRYQLTVSPFAMRAMRIGALTETGLAATVTNATLSTLTAGASSNADALHTHSVASLTGGTNVALLNASNAFTAANSFSAAPTFSNGAAFTLAVGTAPFSVTSTTPVTNLNADMVDGLHAASFLRTDAASTVSGGNALTIAGTLAVNAGATMTIQNQPSFQFPTASGSPFTVVSTTVVTNLNADTLDGINSLAFGQLGIAQTVSGAWTFSGGATFATPPSFTAALGTPFNVTSSTVVTNLNADLLDGINSTSFAQVAATATVSGAWSFTANPSFTNAVVGGAPFSIGPNSSNVLVTGLNADRLDGLNDTDFLRATAGSTLAAGNTLTISGTLAAAIAATVTFANQPSFTIATGAQPFLVTSTTLVTSLNADMVDSLHAVSFLRSDASSALAAGNTLTVNGTLSIASTGVATFANIPAFTSPAASGSPFTVTSNVVVTNLNADTLDGVDSTGFSLTSHTHFGQTWSGSIGTGLTISNSSGAPAFVGNQTNGGGGVAILGQSVSASPGVQGQNTSLGAGSMGVYGTGSAPGVYGVRGDTSTGRGVYGLATGVAGTGLYGDATATSGASFGVQGHTASPAAAGIYGNNTDTGVGNNPIGVWGTGSNAARYGVFGDTSTGRGVVGRASGVAGIGVFGSSIAGTAVYGDETTTGTGGFFQTNTGAFAADVNRSGDAGTTASIALRVRNTGGSSGSAVIGTDETGIDVLTNRASGKVNGNTMGISNRVNGNSSTAGWDVYGIRNEIDAGFSTGWYYGIQNVGGWNSTNTANGAYGIYNYVGWFGAFIGSQYIGIYNAASIDGNRSSTSTLYAYFGSYGYFPTAANATQVYGISQTVNGGASLTGANYAGWFRNAAGSGSSTEIGVYGTVGSVTTPGLLVGVFGRSSLGLGTYGVYSDGNMHVNGTLSKSFGTFLIDHPLDPDNKILRHSFAESPEAMNIYKGRAKLVNGVASITLPEWFDALNHPATREVSLTCKNGWSPLYLDGDVVGNQFTVRTTAQGNQAQDFTWVVYAVRDDPYMRTHPLVVEELKGPANGFTPGRSVHWTGDVIPEEEFEKEVQAHRERGRGTR